MNYMKWKTPGLIIFITICFSLLALIIQSKQSRQVSSNPYIRQTTNSSSITIKGSDTEVQMISALAEEFFKSNPHIKISVTGGGSGVGIAGLINKEIDIANSSRAMKAEELELAKSKNLNVQEFIVARDGLSIIVNQENPVNQLTVEQLGKIYKGDITKWINVGGKDHGITLYGRQSTSGTYTFFRDLVVKADYAASMRNMEGNQAIIDSVKNDKNGIGYVGVGYLVDENGFPKKDVKVIPIAKDSETIAVSPFDTIAVEQGEYPIFRPIYQYLSGLPEKDSPLARLLEFESSAEGQRIIHKTGFYSTTADDIQKNQDLFNSFK